MHCSLVSSPHRVGSTLCAAPESATAAHEPPPHSASCVEPQCSRVCDCSLHSNLRSYGQQSQASHNSNRSSNNNFSNSSSSSSRLSPRDNRARSSPLWPPQLHHHRPPPPPYRNGLPMQRRLQLRLLPKLPRVAAPPLLLPPPDLLQLLPRLTLLQRAPPLSLLLHHRRPRALARIVRTCLTLARVPGGRVAAPRRSCPST